MFGRILFALSVALFASPVLAAQAEPADPLTVSIQLDDLNRFVALFEQTNGAPTAEELQREYLDPGSYGVEVFTPNRIVDAENLAAAIAANSAEYRRAIDECLPHVRAANADLRSIYLGLRGLFPDTPLPQVYVLFGAGNSGGTAALGAQVLGLEVICANAEGADGLRRSLRHFFAHETIHALQDQAGREAGTDYLLQSVLAEGAADFIARMVTGDEPDRARAAWAAPREAELFAQLVADFDTVGMATEATRPQAEAAMHRWVGNYGSAPDGWPGELGYWMGLRIWEGFWEASPDKRDALQRMLLINNPREVLAIARGFQNRGEKPVPSP